MKTEQILKVVGKVAFGVIVIAGGFFAVKELGKDIPKPENAAEAIKEAVEPVAEAVSEAATEA